MRRNCFFRLISDELKSSLRVRVNKNTPSIEWKGLVSSKEGNSRYSARTEKGLSISSIKPPINTKPLSPQVFNGSISANDKASNK
jgi:hypothetical protein